MSCTNPILAYVLTENEGKKVLRFCNRLNDSYSSLCERYGKDNVYFLPCGKCISCRKDRANVWAVRCMLEASDHKDNCFLTLTYNDESLPKNGLCKRDLQKFLKRLSYYIGYKPRTFCCGEYGSKFLRPHYHISLFGFFPDDAKFHHFTKDGFPIFSSEKLSQIWKFGHIYISYISFATCLYTVKYSLKQSNEDPKMVSILLPKGSTPVFHTMSLKPAIGAKYIENNFEKLCKYLGCTYVNGHNQNLGKYFDKLLLKFNPDQLDKIKYERISNMNLSIASDILRLGCLHREEYYKKKGEIALDTFKKKKDRGDL